MYEKRNSDRFIRNPNEEKGMIKEGWRLNSGYVSKFVINFILKQLIVCTECYIIVYKVGRFLVEQRNRAKMEEQ